MEVNSVWCFSLTAKSLCLGERNKKGTYRSSLVNCIPYSQITGALRAKFGSSGKADFLHAVGSLKVFRRQSLVRGTRDVASGISRLPIEADILTDVEAVVYLADNAYTRDLPPAFEVQMGAFRSQGLGICWLERKADSRPIPVQPAEEGILQVRLPDEPGILALFGVQTIAPVWGYLFRPDVRHEGGQYVRALFEGSIVAAPVFLLNQ